MRGRGRRAQPLLLPLLLLALFSARGKGDDDFTFGCKPRNRDLRPDARLNIGILHRPEGCLSNETRRTRKGDKIKVRCCILSLTLAHYLCLLELGFCLLPPCYIISFPHREGSRLCGHLLC